MKEEAYEKSLTEADVYYKKILKPTWEMKRYIRNQSHTGAF